MHYFPFLFSINVLAGVINYIEFVYLFIISNSLTFNIPFKIRKKIQQKLFQLFNFSSMTLYIKHAYNGNDNCFCYLFPMNFLFFCNSCISVNLIFLLDWIKLVSLKISSYETHFNKTHRKSLRNISQIYQKYSEDLKDFLHFCKYAIETQVNLNLFSLFVAINNFYISSC